METPFATSPKGIANLQNFNAEQNLFSKKNRRAVRPPILL
jgi:hypothetical protein